MTIAILYSLPTKRAKLSAFVAADDDTVLSAYEIQDAVIACGWKPILVPVPEDAIEKTVGAIHADCIVNSIDWTGVELPLSLRVMDALDRLGIPYTGADRISFEHGSDKMEMKHVMEQFHLPTPRWQIFETGEEVFRTDFQYPLIVKLGKEHCSIGIDATAVKTNESDVRTHIAELIKQFEQPVIVEEFIRGREFQVTALETELGIWMLPPAEIIFRTKEMQMLTYESRWNENHPDFHTSTVQLADLTDTEMSELLRIVPLTFTAFGFHDYTRLDMRMSESGKLYILEANANPGLGDDELYGMTVSYKAVGWTFTDLIRSIILSCLRRFSVEQKPLP